MKYRAQFFVGLLVVAALLPVPILAQNSRANGESPYLRPVVARDSSSHQEAPESASDILNVVIYKAVASGDGSTRRVGPPINPAEKHTFQSGERIVVSFTPTFRSYVYFINRGPEGTRVIFPSKASDIRATVPDETRNQPLQFNDREGQEELIVVVSRDRLKKLDDAIARPDKLLDAGAGPSSTEVVPDRPRDRKPDTHPPKTIKRGKKTYRVFHESGLIAANTSRWDVVENISSPDAGTTPSSRGLECLQEEGDASVQVRPVVDEKGSYRFGPGQVGAFSIVFEHR